MGLPEYLEPVIQTRRFLTDFFWITYANDDEYSWHEAELNFPVGPEFGLSVKVDNYISTIQLHFNSQDRSTSSATTITSTGNLTSYAGQS